MWLFSLRYSVEVKGLDKLKKRDPEGGYLFLPNHPTVMIDPLLIGCEVMTKMPVRSVVVDYMYYMKYIHFLFKWIKAVPIPNFSNTTNTHKLRRMDKALDEVVQGLNKGGNYIFYPAGKVKLTAKEQVGGASGLNKILRESEHYNVVLVRITGLWGSIFSRAHPQHTHKMMVDALTGIKATLKNLLFFNPRRKITIEFEMAPPDFPIDGSRSAQNRWLENWYNKGQEGEPLYFVPFSAWTKKLPTSVSHEIEEEEEIDLARVPEQVVQKVKAKLSKMTDIPEDEIHPNTSLATDLGIDSLDAAEVALFLEEQFDVKDVAADELTTVRKILGLATKQIKPEPAEEGKLPLSKWKLPHNPVKVHLPTGNSLEEIFLKTCNRMSSEVACADERSGVLTYKDLLVRSLLMAEKFKKLKGKYVGLLVPSSIGAMVLYFALRLAGKIPVMVNWTVGPRHINSVVDATGMEVCLSSWAFLDRLSNIDLGKLVDHLVEVEDMRETITLSDKLKALVLSKQSIPKLIERYRLHEKSIEDIAVLLFTSGSEGVPKGVPLSHRNILSNIEGIIKSVDIFENDVFLSILPPFHSFGFTICGMAPMLLGVKAVYYPNPTEGPKLARAAERWKATILCGAPSFLKNIFKSAVEEQLNRLRLVVTGAEKAPEELYLMAKRAGIDEMIEGYGITECSPVLTLNYPGEERKGVGRPLPEVDIDVVHLESHEKLPINQQGMILAAGPNIFSGYFNSDKRPFIWRGGKEWYITGDLGFLDELGRLTLTGRLKRFVKVGPEMISLGAIEEAIAETLESENGPSVAVCAKEIPGEKPKFYLFTTLPLTVEKVNHLLRDAGFSNLIRIHHVQQLEKMPLMGSGKINYQQLENTYV